MSSWEALLLGLVQGLTEFLPVSSSGHLVLGKYLLGLDTSAADNVTFDVFVHFGTVLSILTIYWRDVIVILRDSWLAVRRPSSIRHSYQEREGFRTAFLIGITMVPTGIVYIVFKDALEAAFQEPRLACGMLLVTGTLLLLTLLRRSPEGRVTPLKAVLIGLAQSAAMIPGISRSGATICTALYQNVTPARAANFSFLMLLPVVIGATLIKSLEIAEFGIGIGFMPLFLGTLIAYVSGVVAIKLVINFVRRGTLHYFAFYVFAVGIVGLIYI